MKQTTATTQTHITEWTTTDKRNNQRGNDRMCLYLLEPTKQQISEGQVASGY